MADWENEARHRAYVGLAASLERLPDAARRYRSAREDPRLSARANAGLDRVLGAAMASLSPAARAPRPKPVNVMIPLTVLAAALMATVVLARVTEFRTLTSPVVILGEVLIVALIPWRRFTGTSD